MNMPKESIQGEEIMATATTPGRPPLPPFTRESAIQKVRLAEDGWNTRDPAKVALAYATRFTVEEPLGVHQRAKRNYCFPLSQVGQRTRLQAHQRNVGIHGKPHCRALCL